MAIEKRGNRFYYYRKKREGSRVFSIYVGGGLVAINASKSDQRERKRRQAERDSIQSTREADATLERQLAEEERQIKGILRAALEAAGFHQHKGTWRKKRK
jgi:hypothetical protein